MARRRKSRKSHRRARRHAAPVANAPRRRRSHRKSHRRARRSYHHNPGPGMWKDLLMAVVAGGVGYIGAQKVADLAEQYMPSMIPRPDIVGPAAAAVAFIALTEKFVRDPKSRAAAQAAAAIPLVVALVNASGLGHTLGTQPMVALPAPSPAAALSASLQAQLEDSYSSDY